MTDCPPAIKYRCLEYCYTNLADIAQSTYTHGRLTPPPPQIEHRSLESQYTKYVTYII